MLRQFYEISSWRKHDITIEANDVYTLNFRDTTPNIFVLNNPNLATLKLGISAIPREDSYEFKVEYNTTETIGRPIGTNNLYIFNDSSIPIKIVVFSIEKDFDPSILKNMNVSLEGYTLEASSTISGVKSGVKIPVKMDDTQHVELKNILNDIKTNSLTRLELGALKAHVESIYEYIRDMREEKSTRENDPTYLNNIDAFSWYAYNSETVHFEWLFNDGCDVTVYRTRNNVKTALFSIKKDEAFADFEFELDTDDYLTIEGTDGSASMRIKYWSYLR